MPIRVTIIEDAEIRADIKKMIAGQFKSLIRAEVRTTYRPQIEEAYKAVDIRTLAERVVVEITSEITRQIIKDKV